MIEEKTKRTRSKKYEIEDNETLKKEEPKQEITKEKKEHPVLKKILLTISSILILVILYSTLIGTRIIDINEYKVESPSLPESFHGIKIIHFSDIHYGTTINKKQLDNIVKKINNLKPDIIFFTGD
jgi:hypothetical protein